MAEIRLASDDVYPADTIRVSIIQSGAHAVVSVHGGVEESAARLVPFLHALLDSGAERVIVELPAVAAMSVPVLDRLRSVRAELRRRGGWLVIDSADGSLDPDEPPLDEVFRAYREVVRPSPEPA